MGTWSPGPGATEGADTFTGDATGEDINGLGGDDHLMGNGGADTLTGGAGADLIEGGAGDDVLAGPTYGQFDGTLDTLEGGAGSDYLYYGNVTYVHSPSAVTVNLSAGTVTGGDAAGDHIFGAYSLIGSGFNDNLTTYDYNTALFGGAGADMLTGLAGADTLNGGTGADTLDGGGGFNTVSYVGSSGAVNVNLTAGTNSGGDAQGDVLSHFQSIIGTGLNDTLTGEASANSLEGGAGADSLSGLAGDDTLLGGAGADTISGGDGVDTLDFTSSANGVSANLTTGAGGAGEALGDVYTSMEYILGSDFGDSLTGDTGANVLWGRAGDDVVNGMGGDDVVRGGLGNNTIDGGDGIDTVIYYDAPTLHLTVNLTTGEVTRGVPDSLIEHDTISNVENVVGGFSQDNTLIGSSANNVLTGGDREDHLSGMGGDDTLIGGGGFNYYEGGAGADLLMGSNNANDNADYTSSLAGVTIDLIAQSGLGGDAEGDTLIEINNVTGSELGGDTLLGSDEYNVFYGLGGADWLVGRNNDDYLVGGAGDDTLDGGAGVDQMLGGDGVDTASYADASEAIYVSLADGQGMDGAISADTLTDIENVIGSDYADALLGDSGANSLWGGGDADWLSGADGADTLDGGAGADTMQGGLGDDVFFVGSGSDVVMESAGEGLDTIRSTVGIAALAVNVENLELLGTAALATGNALANRITGNASNNTIDGKAGADTMLGGAGNDTYVVDNNGDVVTESAGAGTDIIFSTVDINSLAQEVENLTLSGTVALLATGNSLNNVLTGNTLNNTLNGGAGEDSMAGGFGNDTYLVNSAGDVVTEAASAGFDTIISSIDMATLAANVDNLTLIGSALIGGGNELANVIVGNGFGNTLTGGLGGDQLNGAGGADTMSGGAGDDSYLVENAGDVVNEVSGEGFDTVYAFVSIAALAVNVEKLTLMPAGGAIDGVANELDNRLNGNDSANVLTGLGGADVINGLGGNDHIIGGAGLDNITGGTGSDVFVYQAASDSGLTGATRDLINDFTQGFDTIDLSAIDAITGGADDAFTLIGASAFNHVAGELRYDLLDNAGSANDFTVVSMDVNGDGAADSQITLRGLVTLSNSDFVL